MQPSLRFFLVDIESFCLNFGLVAIDKGLTISYGSLEKRFKPVLGDWN